MEAKPWRRHGAHLFAHPTRRDTSATALLVSGVVDKVLAMLNVEALSDPALAARARAVLDVADGPVDGGPCGTHMTVCTGVHSASRATLDISVTNIIGHIVVTTTDGT